MRYEVVYERRKSIRGFVKEDYILIKAPYFTPQSVIEQFVAKYRDYFAAKLEPKKLYYLGIPFPLQKSPGTFRFTGEIFIGNNWREGYEEFLMAKARRYLPQRLEYLAARYGVEYARLRINRAKSRWGSCSSHGNINLSCRLMALPLHTIDYVIVHELCHRTHMNHSRAFWKLVASRCKAYKYIETELKTLSEYIL